MTDDTIDPKRCSFCEEDSPNYVPSEGRMLIVLEGTQDILFETDFGACVPCGHTYTDVKICEKPEDGRVGVFQFEHHDYESDEIQAQIPMLAEEIETMACAACGESMSDMGSPKYSPREFAIKMLRMAPSADSLVAVCAHCSEQGLCPCCEGYDED